ncbi:MAG: ABC transporter permease [Treponemataceae bacterium]
MRFVRDVVSYCLIALIVVLVAALCVRAVGSDVSKAALGFFRGAFGSAYGISEVLVRATPLMLSALGVSIGFQTGFFNIGAEGQIYVGAAATTAVALAFPSLSPAAMIPLALGAGFVAGGVWALIPGFLKARFGLSEIINTIMFSYIAVNVVGILVRTVLKDPSYPLPMSSETPQSLSLPLLMETSRLHAGFPIALLSAFFVHALMRWTVPGFRMRSVGLNPRASRCVGISVYGNLLLAAFLGGGFAGLAGACEIAGVHHKLLEGISPGFGYTAIIVALLGRSRPAGIVVASLGIAALQIGSMSMQRSAGVPSSIAWIVMGLLVLLILARPRLVELIPAGTKEAFR